MLTRASKSKAYPRGWRVIFRASERESLAGTAVLYIVRIGDHTGLQPQITTALQLLAIKYTTFMAITNHKRTHTNRRSTTALEDCFSPRHTKNTPASLLLSARTTKHYIPLHVISWSIISKQCTRNPTKIHDTKHKVNVTLL